MSGTSLYRVVCSVDPAQPEKFYIDFCRDGFCSHDLLFRMQQKYYNNDNLERVFNDSRGIFLRESADGSISLQYTKHNDRMAMLAQQRKRDIIDPQIIAAFHKMREKGAFQSISVSLQEVNRELGEAGVKKGYAESLQQEEAAAYIERDNRLKRLKKIRNDFYAGQKHASAPHLALMMKQLEHSGD